MYNLTQMANTNLIFIFCTLLIHRVVTYEDCVTFDFNEGHDSFNFNHPLCSEIQDTWTSEFYSSSTVIRPHPASEKFITPTGENNCVASFNFKVINGGTVEILVYTDEGNVLTIMAADQHNIPVETIMYGSLVDNFSPDWTFITMDLTNKTCDPCVIVFIAFVSDNTDMLIDSFRYIPSNIDDKECKVYAEEDTTVADTTTTEITTDDASTSDYTTVPETTTTYTDETTAFESTTILSTTYSEETTAYDSSTTDSTTSDDTTQSETTSISTNSSEDSTDSTLTSHLTTSEKTTSSDSTTPILEETTVSDLTTTILESTASISTISSEDTTITDSTLPLYTTTPYETTEETDITEELQTTTELPEEETTIEVESDTSPSESTDSGNNTTESPDKIESESSLWNTFVIFTLVGVGLFTVLAVTAMLFYQLGVRKSRSELPKILFYDVEELPPTIRVPRARAADNHSPYKRNDYFQYY